MMITTTFGGLMEKWIEQEVENGIYPSPQELVRDAVRRLRESSLQVTASPNDGDEKGYEEDFGSLLEDIHGSEINVRRDYRIPVGAKQGRILVLTLKELPPNARIKITAKVPGYDRSYKETPWFFLEKSNSKSVVVSRSEEHPNRWLVQLPPKKQGTQEDYILDFQELIKSMQGYSELTFRSLSTIRFENLPQSALLKVRIFEGK